MDYFLVGILLAGFVVAIVGIVLLIVDFIKKRAKKISLVIVAIGVAMFVISVIGLNIYVNHENNQPLVLKTEQKEYQVPQGKETITIPIATTEGAEISGYDTGGSPWKLNRQRVTSDMTNLTVKATSYRLDIKLKETLGDKVKTIKFSVYPASNSKANSSSASAQSSSVEKSVPFGTSKAMGNGSMAATVTMVSAQQVDPNEAGVTDLSHNYPNLKQFVMVTYKVTALTDSIPTDTFDGANFSYVDDQGSMGQTSSNRDPGTAESIDKGQSVTLRIGVGLENQSSNLKVEIGNVTFEGAIQ